MREVKWQGLMIHRELASGQGNPAWCCAEGEVGNEEWASVGIPWGVTAHPGAVQGEPGAVPDLD